jgi:hypothetical protein
MFIALKKTTTYRLEVSFRLGLVKLGFIQNIRELLFLIIILIG